MPLGYNPKDLPKIAAFPEPSDDWQAGGVFEWTGPRAAPEGTMLQSPFVLNPATVKNAKTQNAVKIASMDVPSPGEPRPGRKNALESAPSRDATIKNMATKEGASPDAQLAKSPGGLPYFTDTTSQPGIEKITVKGQSPLFTNMGGAGLDDLSKKGAQLPSVPSFLAGVPSFGAGVRAPVQETGTMFSPDGGVGGGGGVLSAMYSRINDYQDRADKLLNSSGIVDQYRGRQLLRARARLVNDLTSLSGADAAMAQSNAALAAVGVAQQRANQEGTQNAASNYLRLQELKETGRAHELAFLPRLEDAVRGRRYQQAAAAGDAAALASIPQEGKFPPAQRNPTIQFSPSGSHVVVSDHLGIRAIALDELLKGGTANSAAREALSRTAQER